ncbi:MAG: glycosyltransferase [Bacteroidota bacterium]
MVDILFIPDFEEGHIFPSLKIASNLKEAGYRVAYMGIPDVMKVVEKKGFETYPIFENFYPLGYVQTIKKGRIENQEEKERHYRALISGQLDPLIKKLRPRLMICSFFIALDVLLLHYKYGIPQAIYHSILPFLDNKMSKESNRLALVTQANCIEKIVHLSGTLPADLLQFVQAQGIVFSDLPQIVSPLLQMPQLMPCPKALDVLEVGHHPLEVYLGPRIRNKSDASISLAPFLPKDRNKKVIYASMGSQVSVYPEKVKRLFLLLIACMREAQMNNFHLILSANAFHGDKDFQDLPHNVSVHPWVPQVEILAHTDLAIIHGGLGSLKECIYFAVPMLVIPMGRDQFDNARRVHTHHLGHTADITYLTTNQLVDSILDTQSNPKIIQGIQQMSALFHREETLLREIDLVRSILQPLTSGMGR